MAFIFMGFGPAGGVADADPSLGIYASASLTDVLPKVAQAWQETPTGAGVKVTFSFDSSARQAKQIERGAPADLYFSANEAWMAYLEKKDLIAKSTRQNLLTNQLVVAVPKDSELEPTTGGPIPTPLGLAGENVPAGIYGQAALVQLGEWPKLKNQVIRGQNVRTVLSWVILGEVKAGIVYQTDVLTARDKVKVWRTFPAAAHTKIIYPVAVVKGSDLAKAASAFLQFCQSPAANSLFQQAGFGLAKDPPLAATP